MATTDTCFHCALPIPADCTIDVAIGDERRRVCCPGCKAVAELIRDSGFERYYALRDQPQPGVGRPTDESSEWRVFDTEDMAAAFSEADDGFRSATIYVGGMYCSACSWLIESTLATTPGVREADVNPVTHRLRVAWDESAQSLGSVLATVAGLGYRPQPLTPDSSERPEVAEQRAALKRLLVASLGMMQVMMFAVALYSGEFQGIDAAMQRFLRLVSLVVTTPVVFYAAAPFFSAAWRGLRARRPGMDLPVSIAIGSAYAASVFATYTDGPAVWFDSVTMFVFFLSVGRFLEMRARHRSIDRSTALSSLLPNTVIRIDADGQSTVPANRLVAGNRILLRPGDSVPADGEIVTGSTSVDESLLTGESRPRSRVPGDAVIAGSVNLDGMIEMRVDRTGVDTTLGTISRLSERARYARPAFVQLADRVASYIVVAILLLAAVVAGAWTMIDAERAFVVTLSVLVVTCPCALALATPAAFAAAGSRLSELRLLITNGNAIEALARATHVMFDKTGTLTLGAPRVASMRLSADGYDDQRCLQIAAALEVASTHPIARAFVAYPTPLAAEKLDVAVGEGVTGELDGEPWRIGSAEYVAAIAPLADTGPVDSTTVYLARRGELVCQFELDDNLRPDARETVDELRGLGLDLSLVSGDAAGPVERVASSLGIDNTRATASPSVKLDFIRGLQAREEVVIAVGDGINDAPVLAGADTSIAPSDAAELAQTSADVLMLGESLKPLATAVRAARQTMRIVRQNLGWAIVYNISAVPLAAAGLVPPWLAAIGMSASSLIVVLNALRLSRFE